MKKIKLIGALAIFATASTLLFTGCPKEPEEPVNPGQSDPVDNPEDPEGNDDPEKPADIKFFLDDYEFKMNFVGADIAVPVDTWSSGTSITKNDDGTLTLTSTDAMWGGNPGVVAAFVQLKKGIISMYDYIAFTADFSNFTISDGDGNNGVNIKVPETQLKVADKNENKDGTVTYYIKTTDFGEAPKAANEFAIIIGGTGTVKLTQTYLAAENNPVKPVSSISISPDTANVVAGDKVTFTVNDSNYNDVTASTVFTIDGEDETASSVEANVLTAGSKSGTVTVKATYTNEDGTFEAKATVKVTATVNNLVKEVSLKRAFLQPGWAEVILADVTTLEETKGLVTIENNVATFALPAGLNGQWQAQLLLGTDADVKTGDEWYFSCKLSGISGNYTLKLNDNEVLVPMMNTVAFTDGEVISCSGTSPENMENISLMFDFGNCPEGTLTISDITFAVTKPADAE